MSAIRFALISHVLPPAPSGQAVILYRILAGVEPDRYYLIDSGSDASSGVQATEERFCLKSKYYCLPSERRLIYAHFPGISQMLSIFNFFVQGITRTKNIVEILRQEPHTSSIIACSGDLVNIPAAFLASRKAHIPFYVYVFDDYVFQWTGLKRWIAKFAASFIFKYSAGVICPNEFICEEYRQRYSILPALIRNPCDEQELERNHHAPWPVEGKKIKIIYTGAIYHANYDCFRNLLRAMDTLTQYPLELHIYTAQTNEQLRAQGITGEKVFVHSHTSYDETLDQQRNADILFLPLAFKSSIPEVIRTSAPGKLGEYLESGRPILAHVPANSFVAYYFRKYQCGFLADTSDPLKLSLEIEKLISSDELRNKIAQKAMQQARIDFSPGTAREQFLALVKNSMDVVWEK